MIVILAGYAVAGLVALAGVVGFTFKAEAFARQCCTAIRAWFDARAGRHRAAHGHGAMRHDLGTLRRAR